MLRRVPRAELVRTLGWEATPTGVDGRPCQRRDLGSPLPEGAEPVTDHGEARRSYDAVAAAYDAAIGGELAGRPLERALLTALAERCGAGVALDVGCGPGHVGAELAGAGSVALGVDLSGAMCAAALRRGVPAALGDLVALPVATGLASGLVCWYALIHLDASERANAYGEMRRVLRPGGWALVGFHTADETARPGDARHLDLWFDRPVELDFRFLDPAAEVAAAARAGLRLLARLDRAPGPGEHRSSRTYLVLERPA